MGHLANHIQSEAEPMNQPPSLPLDCNGQPIRVGVRVRIVGLSGRWLDELPADEKRDVSSMIGEVFEVEEIDEHGHPWVRKSWPNEEQGRCHSHSIALESQEMVLVDDAAL